MIRKYPKSKKWCSTDVYWYCDSKRPIAYSTKGASDLITVLAEGGCTIKELRDLINYDEEAKMVLDEYIQRGFGHCIAKEYFR